MRLHSGPALAGGIAGVATAAAFAYLTAADGDADRADPAAVAVVAAAGAPYAVALVAAFVERAVARWPLLVGAALASMGQTFLFPPFGLPFAFAAVLLLAAALHVFTVVEWSGVDDTLRFLAAVVGAALLVGAVALPAVVERLGCREERPAGTAPAGGEGADRCPADVMTLAWGLGAGATAAGSVVLAVAARAGRESAADTDTATL